MAFKILNLATGEAYNGTLSDRQYDLPVKQYETKELAALQLELLLMTSQVLRTNTVKSHYMEIVEVEDVQST